MHAKKNSEGKKTGYTFLMENEGPQYIYSGLYLTKCTFKFIFIVYRFQKISTFFVYIYLLYIII